MRVFWVLLMCITLTAGCSEPVQQQEIPATDEPMSLGNIIRIMPVDQVLARMEILEHRIQELEKKCKVTVR